NLCIFFSRRSRHTSFGCGWSSDVALPISQFRLVPTAAAWASASRSRCLAYVGAVGTSRNCADLRRRKSGPDSGVFREVSRHWSVKCLAVGAEAHQQQQAQSAVAQAPAAAPTKKQPATTMVEGMLASVQLDPDAYASILRKHPE